MEHVGLSLYTDCSLRQGARPLKGTYKGILFTYFWEFFGSIWAHKGPHAADTGSHFDHMNKTQDNKHQENPNENKQTNGRFSLTFPALQGPGPGPYGPLWAHMDPKNQKKICKKLIFIGAFKVPCTLPQVTVCRICSCYPFVGDSYCPWPSPPHLAPLSSGHGQYLLVSVKTPWETL